MGIKSITKGEDGAGYIQARGSKWGYRGGISWKNNARET
jgi:hypothetical protein